MKKLTILTTIILAAITTTAQIINIPADYPTIQEGINVAKEGDTVLVQPGTYYENINFEGKNITVASLYLTTVESSYIAQTIIDGNENGRVVTIEEGEDSTAVLCGFTIQNGYYEGQGGGIYCYGSDPILRDLLIKNCSAIQYYGGSGGGIYCNFSNLTLQNSTIENCSSRLGAGIHVRNSNPLIRDVQIINNTTDDIDRCGDPSSGIGGGVYLDGMTGAVFENVIISGNAAFTGGGIHSSSDSISIFRNVTIKNNFAKHHGGGLHIHDQPPVFDDDQRCNIYLNTAGMGNDLFSEIDNIVVVLDTFSVIYPTEFHAEPLENFDLEILNGKIIQINADVFVSPSGDNQNSGLTETEPFKTIHHAFSMLRADSLNQLTIHLLEGIYSDSANGELMPVNIIDYVSLNGASASNTILDASGQSRVIHINMNQSNAISNLTIMRGSAEGEGGGIYCNQTNMNLNHVTISGNDISSYNYSGLAKGGGLFFNESNVVLNDIKVEYNTVTRGGSGAGICFIDTEAILSNVTLTGNQAQPTWNYYINDGGAGMYALNSNISYTNGVVSNNEAFHGGGLFFSGYSSVSLNNIIIEGNTADNGGGIYCSDTVTSYFKNLTIRNNYATNGGGIYWANQQPAIFDASERCNIYNNEASSGNDLFTEESFVVVVDTFSVKSPTEFFAEPINMFAFDIMHGKIEQVDADLYVSPDGDNTNSGLTTDKPLKTIRQAFVKIIADKDHRHTIRLGEGTYSESKTGEFFPVKVPNYINLAGVSDTAVILDGEWSSEIKEFEDVVMLLRNNNTSNISGMTITGCSDVGIHIVNASPNLEQMIISDNLNGIRCEQSNPFLKNLVVTKNIEEGIKLTHSSGPELQNVVISENGDNGMLIFDHSYPLLQNVIITKNRGHYGAGLNCYNSRPVLENVLISENTGDGINFHQDDTPVLSDVTITDNNGIGLCFEGSRIYMNNCIVSNNNEGGIVHNATGDGSFLENVKVMGNTSRNGAGLKIESDLYLKNAVIKNNVADHYGGGIYCKDAKLTLSSSTLTDNQALYGGGIAIAGESDLKFDSINRCNIYLNSAKEGRDLYSSDNFVEVFADTFTVSFPNDIYADRIENFSFDINHGLFELVNADMYISPDGDNMNSGMSPSEPKKNIHLVFPIIRADSLNQNTIYLAEGTYSPSSTGEIFPIKLPAYVSVIGSSANNTILDAENESDVIEIMTNAFNEISGITITGANWTGIDCSESNPYMHDLVITENRTGLNFYKSKPVIESVTVSDNEYTGINSSSSEMLLQESIISGNTGGKGSGIYINQDTGTIIRNSVVTNNISDDRGGGLYCQDAEILIENVIFKENEALHGGGVFFTGSNPVLTNVLFENNLAERYAGAFFSFESDSKLNNLTFSNNTAMREGGGIWIQKSDLSLVNNIVWNNIPESIYLYYIFPTSLTVSWSDIEGGKDEIFASDNATINWLDGNIDEDPHFVNIGDFQYALSDDSPCINSGSPDTFGLFLPELDLLGNPRVWDNRVDMGVVEWNSLGVEESGVQSLKFGVWSYPNPFSTFTTIEYELKKAGHVRLFIYNHLGEQVAELFNGHQISGKHQIVWHPDNLQAGVYFCVLKTENGTQTTKMIKL